MKAKGKERTRQEQEERGTGGGESGRNQKTREGGYKMWTVLRDERIEKIKVREEMEG